MNTKQSLQIFCLNHLPLNFIGNSLKKISLKWLLFEILKRKILSTAFTTGVFPKCIQLNQSFRLKYSFVGTKTSQEYLDFLYFFFEKKNSLPRRHFISAKMKILELKVKFLRQHISLLYIFFGTENV